MNLTPELLINKYGFHKIKNTNDDLHGEYLYHYGQFCLYELDNCGCRNNRFMIYGIPDMFGLKSIQTEAQLKKVVKTLFGDDTFLK